MGEKNQLSHPVQWKEKRVGLELPPLENPLYLHHTSIPATTLLSSLVEMILLITFPIAPELPQITMFVKIIHSFH